ncbi:FtsX-like permease family protein [Pontibacter qinzhouensis]|uniref:FtsX-like permease family protein n=1 Tax=Pontibacter qinzhouensis TaxID=2603253 RepID=A0A5C8KBD4_9BACT|nr:ABC transporter permease [Pontibacter qinzhouensis]TXK52811.1 FtsX-like permease family protein [Pontibacter qinzhouensis]
MIYLRLIVESFRFAWQALKSNLLRTILSLLGVTIGIFAIISVFTLVDSLERNVREAMSFVGERVIYVQTQPWTFGPGGRPWWDYLRRPQPTAREFRQMERNITMAEGIAIFSERGGNTFKYRNSSYSNAILSGATYDFNKIRDIPIENGRYFVPQEVDGSQNVIIIGSDIAEAFFPNQDPLGKQIKVKGHQFMVIGVMEKQGESMFGMSNVDKQGIIPFGAYSKIYTMGPKGMYATIALKGREDDKGLQELEYETQGLLRNIRGLRPRDKDNFALNRSEMVAEQVTSLFSVIGVAGWVIGGFAILVGGFGIANIMFVSVKERTNIIGIQKSLGAKNFFILFQFLFESVFLSLLGGGFGILLVFLLTLIPQDMMEIMLSFSNIVLGLSVSAVIGMLSGIIPAVLAANLDPVMAIRSK